MDIDDLFAQLTTLIDKLTTDEAQRDDVRAIICAVEQRLNNRVQVTQQVGVAAPGSHIVGLQAIIHRPGLDADLRQKLEAIHRQLVQQRVFVSSTWLDLSGYRNNLCGWLENAWFYRVVGFETTMAGAGHPIRSCKAQIEESDLFTGLYGPRYGTVPSAPQISYTEQELIYARKHFRRCFCFISSPDVPDLVLTPVANPGEPVQEAAPQFSDYYREPSSLRKLLDRLLSMIQVEFRSGLEVQRIRAKENHDAAVGAVKENNDRRAADYERRRRVYDDYLFQRDRQEQFRNRVVREMHPEVFASLPELRALLDRVLDEYRAGRRTGFVAADIGRRWQKWAAVEETALCYGLLDLQPLLPSSLEYVGPSNSTNPPPPNPLEGFLTYEWHREAQRCSEELRAAYLAACQLPYIGNRAPALEPPPTDFDGPYDVVASRLKSWCDAHSRSYDEAKRLRKDFVAEVQRAIGAWSRALDQLADDLGRRPRDPGLWLARLADAAQESYRSSAAASRIPLLAPAIAQPIEPPDLLQAGSGRLADGLRVVVACLKEWHAGAISTCDQAQTVLTAYKNRSEAVLGRWNASITRLKRLLTPLRYGRALFLTGGAGAGKTHAVARILQEGLCAGFYPLILERRQRHLDWETQILKAATLQTGPGVKDVGPVWRNLEELDAYVSGRTAEKFGPGRLVIILDDLGAWLREAESGGTTPLFAGLLDFIEQHTHLHSLHWLITIPEADYNRIAHYRERCQKCSLPWPDAVQRLPGWLSLDAVNDQAEIWSAIFRKSGVPDKAITLTREHAVHSARRLLNVPFTAWMVSLLIREGKTPQECLTLNYIDFVDKFWSYRSRELIEDGGGLNLEPQIRRCINLLATRFALFGQEQYGREELLELLAAIDEREGKLADPSIADSILANLARRRFLAAGPVSGPLDDAADEIADAGQRWSLDTLPFWQNEGGKHLAKELLREEFEPGRARSLALQWFGWEPATDARLGLFEFALLHLDKRAEPARGSGHETWDVGWARLAAVEWEAKRGHLWLLAANGSPAFQVRFAAEIEELQARPDGLPMRDPEDLLRFMYFLKYARVPENGSGLAPHERLRLLQPYYPQLQTDNLVDYFDSLLVETLPDWIGGEELARTVPYLFGAEKFWDAEATGRRLYNCLSSLAAGNHDLLAQWLRRALSTEMNRLYRTKPGLLESLRSYDGVRADHDRIAGWVISDFCDSLVAEQGLESLDWLAKRSWFAWTNAGDDLDRRVWNLLEEQITTAIVRSLAWADVDGQKAFAATAKMMMASSSGAERATGGYLCYHAIWDSGLPSKFKERLANLMTKLADDDDPRVRRLWERHMQKA